MTQGATISLRMQSGVPVVEITGEWVSGVTERVLETMDRLAQAGHLVMVLNLRRSMLASVSALRGVRRSSSCGSAMAAWRLWLRWSRSAPSRGLSVKDASGFLAPRRVRAAESRVTTCGSLNHHAQRLLHPIESRASADQKRATDMQSEENTRLKIVRLLEPALCLSCRFASVAKVEMQDSSSRRMLHCRRLDCDNWQTEETEETPRSIAEEE